MHFPRYLLTLLPLLHPALSLPYPFPESDPAAQSSTNALSNIFSCPAASWPPGIGQPIAAQPVDRELQQIMSEISTANIEAIILKLVSFGTRHTCSEQNSTTRGVGAARDWIAGEMRKFAAKSEGRMVVTVPSYIQPVAARIPFPTRISDVVATLKGSEDPGRVYVVSGHYDSRVTDILNYKDDAPGADDEFVLLRSHAPHYSLGVDLSAVPLE